jgi:hypothetical protein
VTVTILNADERIGTHVFATVARNDAGPALDRGHSGHSLIKCYGMPMSALTLPAQPVAATQALNLSAGVSNWALPYLTLRSFNPVCLAPRSALGQQRK